MVRDAAPLRAGVVGVAGARPRPLLRNPSGHPEDLLGHHGVAGDSSPALVARSPSCTGVRSPRLGVARVRPWPLLRVVYHPHLVGDREAALPGSAPALVARKLVDWDARSERAGRCRGFVPGPRCAWLAADKTIGGFRKVLPGFGPGPRCAMVTPTAPHDLGMADGGLKPLLSPPGLTTALHHAHAELSRRQGSSGRCHLVDSLNPN